MFKFDDGADTFCRRESVVDTARKNDQDTFKALIAKIHSKQVLRFRVFLGDDKQIICGKPETIS